MARNTRTFSDLDLNFTAHPVTKDITLKYDENAVKTAVKNLILTKPFERKFRSDIGSRIRALMFEPAGPMLDILLKTEITNVINNYEPRVAIDTIDVVSNVDANNVFVRIIFRVVNTERPLTVDLTLERVR